MKILELNNVSIRGIANCVPKNKILNKNYDWISESERSMLIKTTGIEERRVAEEGSCASDLCYEAASKLMSNLSWTGKDIDVVIFVSQSADYYLPATAIILQDRLGIKNDTLAFDINLGCSGYVYGLHVIGSLLTSGTLKRGLLLCGDISTNSTNPKDKSSYPLFGDSGSATAIEFDPSASKMNFTFGSDGSQHQTIIMKGGGAKYKFHDDSLTEHEISPGIVRHELNLVLEGLDIFSFSVKTVPPTIKSLLEKTNTDLEEIDFFVLHQANKIINDSIRKKLKQDQCKFPSSLKHFGNTSSGSIPLTITTEISKEFDSTKKLVFCGFGVGLSWGAVLIEQKNLILPDLIEY